MGRSGGEETGCGKRESPARERREGSKLGEGEGGGGGRGGGGGPLTDSCLMFSREKSMEGLVLSRSASSSSLNGVTLALLGLLLRGVMLPTQRERERHTYSPTHHHTERDNSPSEWSAATASCWVSGLREGVGMP